MSDVRLGTRSRENTRARLMDAAFDVFAEVGLDAASVEAICERAGFTRGAFYSNFESKDELFLDLVSDVAEQKLQAVTARVRQMRETGDVSVNPASLVQQIADVSMDTRQGVLLMSELRIRAMRDRRTARAYLAWHNGMIERVQGIIDDIVRGYGLRLRIAAEDFARIMLNSWEATSANALIEGLDDDATTALVSSRTQELAAGLVEGFGD